MKEEDRKKLFKEIEKYSELKEKFGGPRFPAPKNPYDKSTWSISSPYYVNPRLYKAAKDYVKWYESYQEHPDPSNYSIMEMCWSILYEEVLKVLHEEVLKGGK